MVPAPDNHVCALMGIVLIADLPGVAGEAAQGHSRCSPPNCGGNPAPGVVLLYVHPQAISLGLAASQARNELRGLRMRAPEATERDGLVVGAHRVQLARLRRDSFKIATTHRLAAVRSGAVRRKGRDPHVQSRKARSETRNVCKNI